MRREILNSVVHAYFSLDLEIVWATASQRVPELARHVASMLAVLEQEQA